MIGFFDWLRATAPLAYLVVLATLVFHARYLSRRVRALEDQLEDQLDE